MNTLGYVSLLVSFMPTPIGICILVPPSCSTYTSSPVYDVKFMCSSLIIALQLLPTPACSLLM